MRANAWQLLCLAVCLAASGISIRAEEQPAAQPIEAKLPADPAAWINSGPLTAAALEGKGAVLYFFEETCPNCRAKWPGLLTYAKSFEGQPVVFIAVNSGNSRQAIEQYAAQCKVGWPIVVDPDRSLEQAADVGEISLQNIHQVCVVTPEGKLVRADWNDMPGAATLALKGAKWKVDPTDMPDSLRPAWSAVELCNYAAAGPAVKKALSSGDSSAKAAAHKLDAVVQEKIEAAVSQAHLTADGGDKYTALQQYIEILKRFDGFNLPAEVGKQRQELLRDSQVRAATKAAKDIEMVQRLLSANSNPATRTRAETVLKKAAKDAAGTQVGKQAEQLLAQMGSSASP